MIERYGRAPESEMPAEQVPDEGADRDALIAAATNSVVQAIARELLARGCHGLGDSRVLREAVKQVVARNLAPNGPGSHAKKGFQPC